MSTATLETPIQAKPAKQKVMLVEGNEAAALGVAGVDVLHRQMDIPEKEPLTGEHRAYLAKLRRHAFRHGQLMQLAGRLAGVHGPAQGVVQDHQLGDGQPPGEPLPLAEVEKLVEPGPMVSVGFFLKELRSVQDRGA